MDEKEELRVVIVDDEEYGRSTLTTLLTEFCPSVRIEAAVSTITQARQAILRYAPDAVFLDIEMPPEGTGFDLVESIHPSFLRFAVIFTTGHREYALQAMRANAVDFLPKPIDIDELERAVNKVRIYKRTQRLEEAGQNVQNLLKTLNAEQQARGIRIMLPTPTGMRVVQLQEVAFFSITPFNTNVQFANGESFASGTPLEISEDMLLANGFVRTNPEFLVNTGYIQYYIDKDEGAKIVLKNGHSVFVTPEFKEGVFERLKV